MSGSRYVIQMDVVGDAPGKLGAIERGVGKVAAAGEQLNKAAGGASGKLDEIASNTRVSALHGLAEEMERFAGNIDSMRERLTSLVTESMRSIITDAAAFEDAESSMKFAFGKDWENVMEQVKADSARLTFTFKQTVDLAASLGRMKINPFGGASAEAQVFKSKTGEAIRALDVLQDTADAVGKSTDDLIVSIRNAMAGNFRSLEERFDIPKEKIKAWKQETDKLGTAQEKYNYLVAQLADMFGGAGALKAANFNKVVAQLPDIMEQLRGTAKEHLHIITEGIQEVVTALKELVEDKEAMKALSDAFKSIATAVKGVLTAGAGVIRWIKDLLKAAPYLPTMAAGFTMVAIAGLTVVSTITAVTLAVVTLSAAIAALEIEVLPIVLAVAAAFAALAAVAAVGVATLALWRKAMNDKEGAEKQIGILDKLQAGWQGLTELVASYDGVTGTMSLNTANAMKKAGVYEETVKWFKAFAWLIDVWHGFTDGLEDATDELYGYTELFDEIGALITEIGEALGLISFDSLKDGEGVGRSLASVLLSIVNGVTEVARWAVAGARIIVAVFTPVVLLVRGLVAVVGLAIAGFTALKQVLSGDFAGAKKTLNDAKQRVTDVGKEAWEYAKKEATPKKSYLPLEAQHSKDEGTHKRADASRNKRDWDREDEAQKAWHKAHPDEAGPAPSVNQRRRRGKSMEEYDRTGLEPPPGAAGPASPSPAMMDADKKAASGEKAAAHAAAANAPVVSGLAQVVAAINAKEFVVNLDGQTIAKSVNGANVPYAGGTT